VQALLAGRPEARSAGPWLLFPTACWRLWLRLGLEAIEELVAHLGSGPADPQRRFLVRVAGLSLLIWRKISGVLITAAGSACWSG